MSNIKLVSRHMYWQLMREVEGRYFLGFSDHRIGLSVSEVTKEIAESLETRDEFKEHRSFTTKEGEFIEYDDEPYTESQIESFGKLTLEQLNDWVKRGN